MVYISYFGEINSKNTNQLFLELNSIARTAYELQGRIPVKLYYSSSGGQIDLAEAQIDALNSALDFCDLEIITGSMIMSAAVEVISDFKGKVTISPHTMGMVHKATILLDYREMSSGTSYSSEVKKLLKPLENRDCKKYKKGFTEDQLRAYNEGKEVYFSGLKFKKFINAINGRDIKVRPKIGSRSNRGAKTSKKSNIRKQDSSSKG